QSRRGSANAHSYDSLASWHYTQSGLNAGNRCDGLSGPCPPASPENTFPIPNDPTCVEPHTGPSCVTTAHMIPSGSGRQAVIYGGTITNIAAPSHDFPTTTGTDDYATVTVTYDLN